MILTAIDQFEELEKHVPEEDIEELPSVVDELQYELVSLSPKGKLLEVKGTGHYIHIDRPGIVINAIHEVVDAI